MGGLLDTNCNPGSATPEMLHRIYASRGAASANPCILRELHNVNAMGNSAYIGNLSHVERLAERESLMASGSAHGTPVPMSGMQMALPVVPQPLFQPARRRAESPPRGHFHPVSREYTAMHAVRGGACSARCLTNGGIQLTMDSLSFGGGGGARRPR